MKNVTKFIKNHKLLILLSILVILFLIFCLKLVLTFTQSDEVVFYGKRLENAPKDAKINKDEKSKKVSEKLSEDAKNATVRVQGRIINIIINLKDDASRDKGKECAKRSLEEFSDKEKEYYDFQFFINRTSEKEDSNQFPFIGYKHHTKAEINWAKDR